MPETLGKISGEIPMEIPKLCGFFGNTELMMNCLSMETSRTVDTYYYYGTFNEIHTGTHELFSILSSHPYIFSLQSYEIGVFFSLVKPPNFACGKTREFF